MKSMKHIYERRMWAVVMVDGSIVTGSDFRNEADAWRVALGWPDEEEIAEAKKRGAFSVLGTFSYEVAKPDPIMVGVKT
jgi:hypothetical protein